MAKRTHTAHLNNVQINSSLNYIRVCFNLLPILCVCVFKCVCLCIKWLQSCSTLSDPVGCSLPGSSVHGILQARILEWTAMPSSRGSSRPRDRACISYISCISKQALYHYLHHHSQTLCSR